MALRNKTPDDQTYFSLAEESGEFINQPYLSNWLAA